MSFDRGALAHAIHEQGPVVRVVIIEAKGSTPREVGASMLVFERAQTGTIGGGALEHLASEAARAQLSAKTAQMFETYKLGPEIDQCCGGSVSVLSERFEATPPLEHGLFARSITGAPERPLAVTRALAEARNGKSVAAPTLIDGWFIEPEAAAKTHVWIWGAGHVGRALVQCLAPLPDLSITWCDTGAERFPSDMPNTVRPKIMTEPGTAMIDAPKTAHHIVLTYSHPLDFAILDAALTHGFASAGVIGSATKWARFSKHLKDLGHSDAAVSRITCPIGAPALGKHPQAIALGVASAFLTDLAAREGTHTEQGEPDDRAAAGA